MIGNLCSVLIYQYWEDYYRARMAEVLDMSADDLEVDIMGDLRHIRRSVIHHRAIAIDDIERCKIIRWFAPGDDIFITDDQFEQLIFQVKKGIYDLLEMRSMNRSET